MNREQLTRVMMQDYWVRWVLHRESLAQLMDIKMRLPHRLAVWIIRKITGKKWP